VIQATEVLTPPVGRKIAETIRQIQAFQHVRASKGTEVMPAGWEPGQPTLKPGPALVGNVWKVWQPKMEKPEEGSPARRLDRAGASRPSSWLDGHRGLANRDRQQRGPQGGSLGYHRARSQLL
jgi:hypothetical protein